MDASGSDEDNANLIIASTITSVAFALLFAIIAYNFPIRNFNDEPQKILSVVLAVCVFPAYLIIYLVQEMKYNNLKGKINTESSF